MPASALRSYLLRVRLHSASSRNLFARVTELPVYQRRRLASVALPAFKRLNQTGRRQFHARCSKLRAIHPSIPRALPKKEDALAATHILEPTPLTDEQYREYSEEYLENLQYEVEDMVEQGSNLDVEYSSGVLTIVAPDKGTYVLNKQPPNKQIWLSSPITGPKRYDWVLLREEMGDWIYLRDGSRLTDLLKEELDISLAA
ncbi:Mitochondrial chaperone Frataxin [Ascosphaera aggregata]|nr:Mitochondrial chaperone Frataxin [Ascosphaera aggregata]